MPSVIQPAEFFVVGGPVQPDRPCYVEREADRQLRDALRAKRCCCVLGPMGTGKSSLLLRTARVLRAAGGLVANVDLRRIVEQPEAQANGLRQFAGRVAAELKLGIDVPAWWEARGLSGENPLVEFFWEVVLTNTTAPVVVLIDDVETALASPLAGDLLEAIGACSARRTREPDFGRLTFALAGAASLRELTEASPESGVEKAEVVVPEDFAAEQAYRLAVAFGGDRNLAHALMDRIYVWTEGHPYLTQRIARGVARKGGRLEDVERVVREQLLAPGAANKDPVLAHMRALLAAPTRPAQRAAKLLHKLAAGRAVPQPADTAVADRLWLSGAAVVSEEGDLRARNRIVRELVAAGWLTRTRGGSKWLAAAAVLLIAIAAGGFWYTQRLPAGDLATLSNPQSSASAAEASYHRLRGLPGFEQQADDLWRAALERHSRNAATLAEARAADARLRELPGQDETADRLLGDFWLRRAREQAHAEQREAAILLAQRAAALPGAGAPARAYLAELVGDDYSRLELAQRLPSAPEYWHLAFERDVAISLDAQRRVQQTLLQAEAAEPVPRAEPATLSALVHSALTRELTAEGEGTAGELALTIAVQHPAASELLVTLTAPSGAAAAVNVPLSDGSAVETFQFQGGIGSPLAPLADEAVSGVWRLTIVDRAAGNEGVFAGWGLEFGELAVRDDLPEPLPLVDPVRTEEVVVRAAADVAVAWPATAGAVGTLALWDLGAGRLARDVTLPVTPIEVALDASGARVLAATDRVLTVWNVADGALAARVGTETEFVLPPVFSADGAYVAIAERVEGANPLYSVLRSEDGSLVSAIDGIANAEGWELGPGGRYVAVRGPETVVRVLETRRGAEIRRLAHSQAVERLLHSADGSMLVTVDRAGAIASWPLALASAERGRPLGRTVSVASVSAAGDGRRIAFTRDDGAVEIVDAIAGAELYRLRIARSQPVTTTQLSPDGMQLAAQSAAELTLWRLPAKPVTPRPATDDALPTALAVDGASGAVALGLASGQLQVLAAGAARLPLSYFGHRGAITAVALNADRGIVATGGADGIVRLWDAATGAPTGAVAEPADTAITAVALSDDGRYVATAAGAVARAARVADGSVALEVATGAAVTALAFASDGAVFAVGDAAGTVTIALLGRSARATLQLGAAATSLAFVPGEDRFAAGDAAGGITLVAADGEVEGSARRWAQPVSWLQFTRDGAALLAATDAWAHSLAATPELSPVHSKLVSWPAQSKALAAVSATTLRFAGVEAGGILAAGAVDLASPPAAQADASAFVTRDWSALFALRLNDNGEPVPTGL